MKIAIIGYSGAGKSTLAKTLGEKYDCPVMHLDCANFEPGWKERDIDQAKKMACDFMKNRSWVIDGNYPQFYRQERLQQADKVIFFDFSRFVCLKQAIARYQKYKNTVRESAAPGCKEKIDFEFVKWILHDGRTREFKAQYAEISAVHAKKIIVLKNRKQVNAFLENV